MYQMDVETPVLDHHQLNLTCQELCEGKAADIPYCESVLQKLTLTFEKLESPNEILARLPNAVKFLSSLLKNLHTLSKTAVARYVDCLAALHVLASREGSSPIRQWVARHTYCDRSAQHCLRHALSLNVRGPGAPTLFEVVDMLRKAKVAGSEIAKGVSSVLSRLLEGNLRCCATFSDDHRRWHMAAAVEVFRYGGGSSYESLVCLLCDLFGTGRIEFDDSTTRELLESCPPILERLILIETMRHCNPSSDDAVGRSSRLMTGLGSCGSSSPHIFRTSMNILLTLYNASRQHRYVQQITLRFLADVQSRVTISDWVLLFDPNIQPLILMMQASPQEHDEALQKMYSVAFCQLVNEMVADRVLDAKSLDLLLQLCPQLNSKK